MESSERLAAAVIHGGDIVATARKLGCRIADLIDMSSNLTPLGMAPGLRELLTERIEEVGFLPEAGSETLRQLFAASWSRSPEEVLAGNGTTEFIFAAPVALRPRRALIVNPTYSDYRLACEWADLDVRSFALDPREDFRLDLERLAKELAGGELVFLCNPNSPTGGLVPSATIHHFIATYPDSLFLVDESYLPFTPEPSLLSLPLLPNLLVLSSYSKIYGIPGLRLGFLTATTENMAQLAARSKPWGVNRLAQIAGEFLIESGREYRQQVLAFLAGQRPAVASALAALPGVRVFQGAANFILARLEGRLTAPELHQRLLDRYRIIIRNCGNFETLDESYFRISLKTEPANRLFLEAMQIIFTETP
ncbi:MAG: aminotransferase class I/II-fold pyridoxal phosphate-dependent enzyme [Deltaproteobacteria bacterium]|jgi:histidinol-phosphate/aromatic aminotransferase/cobyric acid decarboxylase-like protein